jgi:DNA-binding CsgD family transcriptional regulator
MQLLAIGRTNGEIARITQHAEGTVRNTIARLARKFNLADRTQLALLAARTGLGSGHGGGAGGDQHGPI